jgi:hypothetical protein
LIHNLGQIQVSDPRVHGILGENFLEHFDLLIDYARGIVCLDDTKQMQEEVKGEHIALVPPLHLERNLPFTEPLMVPVRVSGVAGSCCCNWIRASTRRCCLTLGDCALLRLRPRRCIVAAPMECRMLTRFCHRRTFRWGCIAYSRFLSSRLLLRAKKFQAQKLTACCRRPFSGAHLSAMRTTLLCWSRDGQLDALSSLFTHNRQSAHRRRLLIINGKSASVRRFADRWVEADFKWRDQCSSGNEERSSRNRGISVRTY